MGTGTTTLKTRLFALAYILFMAALAFGRRSARSAEKRATHRSRHRGRNRNRRERRDQRLPHRYYE